MSPITFGSGKQLFPGLTATGINSVRGALPVRSNVTTEVFTDSGRTLRVETERKRGGNEPEGARKAEGSRERGREV